MAKEIEVKAVYHDDLSSRVRLYILALLELARQLEAEDEPYSDSDDSSTGPADEVREGGDSEHGGRA
ncbi:MAG: hypothetical protein AB1673_08005 [Actinomycetota bacterium]